MQETKLKALADMKVEEPQRTSLHWDRENVCRQNRFEKSIFNIVIKVKVLIRMVNTVFH